MNPLDWRKAAAWVTQHKQEATMAETDQLSSSTFSEKGDQRMSGS